MKSVQNGLAYLLLTCCLVVASPLFAAEPTAQDKCAICGMFVAKFPDWIASIRYQDGTQHFFDGPKDMFTAYLNPAKYAPRKGKADVASVTVKDYYSLKHIDGRRAYFVTGSDVFGPMGKELIPFASEADARAFLKDHKGQRLLRFSDVTRKVLKALE